MALNPEQFEKNPLSIPLPTGFVYRHREDMPEGFELRPEVVAAANARLDDIEERFHRTPHDAHALVAKGAGTSVLQQEEITFN